MEDWLKCQIMLNVKYSQNQKNDYATSYLTFINHARWQYCGFVGGNRSTLRDPTCPTDSSHMLTPGIEPGLQQWEVSALHQSDSTSSIALINTSSLNSLNASYFNAHLHVFNTQENPIWPDWQLLMVTWINSSTFSQLNSVYMHQTYAFQLAITLLPNHNPCKSLWNPYNPII